MEEIIIYRGLYYADIIGIKLLLDNHDVWYRVQDENTSVTMSFSAGIGGIKVYVRREDFLKVVALMRENGMVDESESIEAMYPSESSNDQNEPAAIIRFLAKYSKWVFIVGIGALVAFMAIRYFNAPSDVELLVGRDWYLDMLTASDQQHLNRIDAELGELLDLPEVQHEVYLVAWSGSDFFFFHNGKFIFNMWGLPIEGEWTNDGDEITLKANDGMATFLNTTFEIDIVGKKLKLENDSLVIDARLDMWGTLFY